MYFNYRTRLCIYNTYLKQLYFKMKIINFLAFLGLLAAAFRGNN